METISSGQLYYVYVLLAIFVALITIAVAGKKGIYALMKGKFMETGEKAELLTVDDFEHKCFEKKVTCVKNICDKIQEVKHTQESTEKDIAALKHKSEKDASDIKLQVERNLVTVTSKINGVSSDVKELRISMQLELKEITRFMGSVDQYMKKNNVGK